MSKTNAMLQDKHVEKRPKWRNVYQHTERRELNGGIRWYRGQGGKVGGWEEEEEEKER